MIEIAQMMPRLLEEFPEFRDRWDKHIQNWQGEPAGSHSYIDMSEFVHFVVEDLYVEGDTKRLQRAFDLMEQWISEGDQSVIDLIGYGFLQTLRNFSSWRPFGCAVFVPFLGQNSRRLWLQIEQMWVGKNSLADVIRSERGNKG